jgi:hypothetical protein
MKKTALEQNLLEKEKLIFSLEIFLFPEEKPLLGFKANRTRLQNYRAM